MTAKTAGRSDAQRNIGRILDAAIEVFGRDAEATMSDVATRAGVGRVTVYAHFSSRADLVRSSLELALSRGDALLEELGPSESPLAALDQLVTSSWRLSASSANLWLAARAFMTDAEIRGIHDILFGRAVAVLRWGQQAGDFRNDLPERWLIDSLHSLMKLALDEVTSDELNAAEAPEVVLNSIVALWRTQAR